MGRSSADRPGCVAPGPGERHALSPTCVVILLLALACLAMAIATSPESPDLRYLLDGGGRPPARQDLLLPSAAPPPPDTMTQSCSGGASINCHRKDSHAGL